MKQVLIKQGRAVVEDIPAPMVQPGAVLVQVERSCISSGTEMSGLRHSHVPLWKRALQNPSKVKKVIQMATTQGVSSTRQFVESKLAAGDVGTPTGYSAAGMVLEIGTGIADLEAGERVACAGAQYAHHAEIICVPRNLVVPVPDELSLDEASTVTLGAIALQGVRRAQPTLGETFVVIGLGVLGQLTAQLLRVNGCRVIGTDLVQERIDLARQLGMDLGIEPDGGDDLSQVARLTEGVGADGVIITAATPSDAVIAAAFQMCRKKGRVVLVGDVGLDLNRADFYEKELDFFISTSYGPGRYNRRYEEEGLDYPIGYVRWTENRNMGEYLRLLAERRMDVRPLIQNIYPLERASEAYGSLESGERRPLMVLLAYSRPVELRLERQVVNRRASLAAPGPIRIAVVGAGSFAQGMHLPNLKLMPERYYLQAVMNRNGDRAMAVARQFGAAYATTDFPRILNDPDVTALLISTRHNLHAQLALDALQTGKHVLVEKPLALSRAELDQIQAFYDAAASSGSPVLLTGFNRRFSRYAQQIREIVRDRRNPMIINYRMNAGYIPLDHWVHTQEGGGRNLGEACHIYDLFTFFTNSRVVTVHAATIHPQTHYYSPRDNFVVTITFEDGSLATLTYTASGAAEFPKERMEIYGDGRVVVLDDYKHLEVAGARGNTIRTATPDKGHKQELEAFAAAIQTGEAWPIPLWQQVQATEIALQVEEQLG
jgi:predicted dehydrogenase/threonine dehydrogenase-like Zn-dependent dehydrogenase